MKLDSTGEHFYRDGIYVGRIGTNKWKYDNSKKGLAFNLKDGHFMAWSKSDGTDYVTKLSYFDDSSINPVGLHLGTPLYLNGYNVYISDNENIKKWTDSSGIQTSNCFTIANSSNAAIAKFIQSKYIDFYGELNMHNYNIYNTTIASSSDIRLKKNIENSEVNALDTINSIECKKFKWIEDNRDEELGFIAQQVGHVNPKFITEETRNDETYYAIDQLAMIPYLVKSIQELSDKVESLEQEINELKGTSPSEKAKKRVGITFSKDDKFDLKGIKKQPEINQLDPENPIETGFRNLGNGEVEFFKKERSNSK